MCVHSTEPCKKMCLFHNQLNFREIVCSVEMLETLQKGLNILVYGHLPFSVLFQVYLSMQKSHKWRRNEAGPGSVESPFLNMITCDTIG